MARGHIQALSLVVSWVCASGCSLVALSDDLTRAQCESHADCESLNEDDREADEYDPCNLWQCQDNNYCEKAPRDLDDDGYFATEAAASESTTGDMVSCEVAKAEADCDDSLANRNQGERESCDGIDNDCDIVVDEGSLQVETNDVVAFSSTDGTAVTDVAYSIDPATGALAIGYSLAKGTGTPGLSVIPETLELSAPVNLLRPVLPGSGSSSLFVAEHLGLTALQGSKLAVALMNRSGRPRLNAGVVPGAGKLGELHVDADLWEPGLRCEAAEACAMNHQDPPPDPLEATPETTGFAMASNGRDVLSIYVRDTTGGAPECGSQLGSADAPFILASALRQASGQDLLVETGASALRIDATSTLDTPALVRIGSGFLLGYADADGDIVVAYLTLTDGAVDVVVPALLRIAGSGEQQAAVALAVQGDAAADASELVLGVAFQRGCAPDSSVFARLYDVSVADGVPGGARPKGAAVALGNSPNESRPAITYNAEQALWAVAYRDPRGLRARLLEPDGTLRAGDEDPYLLIETVTNGDGQTRLGLTPMVTSLGSGTWFGAVSYVTTAGTPDEPFAFRAARMVCADN